MKNLTQTFTEYLSFSRGERKGSIVLIGMILGINLIRSLLPGTYKLDPTTAKALENEILQIRTPAGKGSGSATYQAGMPQSKHFVLELNQADTLDLQRIPGIGPSYARRITGYRERLGGYISIDQLLEVYGMDSGRFLGIRKYLTADSSRVLQMNLNTVPFKEMISHPYMPFELAKEIAVYRKRHRTIGRFEELWLMKGADSVTISKLKAYVCFY